MGPRLSLSQARRVGLKAQGLSGVRPTSPVTKGMVGRTFAQLQLVQIDSVNIVARSHLMPFYSRLGNYDVGHLARLSEGKSLSMMEYWAHEASLIRPQHFADLLTWQNRKWVGGGDIDPTLKASLSGKILDLLSDSEPLTSREIAAGVGHVEVKSSENWGWNWSTVKRTLESLFERGVIGSSTRNDHFERRYALIDNVLPTAHSLAGVDRDSLKSQTSMDAAIDRLIEASAQAHGIASIRCLADYFRLPIKATVTSVERLVSRGELNQVSVDGWGDQLLMHPAAVVPRAAKGRALLSPFDSLVFERKRLQELFNFYYRLEIYTPEPKRRYGYYVLPFLLGESLVARVDVKAERQNRVLLVRGSFAEADAPADTASELAQELTIFAGWLGLDEVRIEAKGDLAPALAKEVERLQIPTPELG